MRTSMAVLMLLCFSGRPGAVAADGDAILGLRATEPDAEDGNGHVEIFKQDGKYYGRLVWLEKPEYAADDDQGMGQTKIDRENSDEGLQARPLIGAARHGGFRL